MYIMLLQTSDGMVVVVCRAQVRLYIVWSADESALRLGFAGGAERTYARRNDFSSLSCHLVKLRTPNAIVSQYFSLSRPAV